MVSFFAAILLSLKSGFIFFVSFLLAGLFGRFAVTILRILCFYFRIGEFVSRFGVYSVELLPSEFRAERIRAHSSLRGVRSDYFFSCASIGVKSKAALGRWGRGTPSS